MVMLLSFNHVVNRKKVFAVVLLCFFAQLFLFSKTVKADGMSITVAPPLFQVNLRPGETWSSGVSVVNNNKYDTKLYAETVLFEPSGESGKPNFVSIHESNGLNGSSLRDGSIVDWITVPKTSFSIRREQTYVLPIAIDVPGDAPPGGHYAAILIGNKAPEDVDNSNAVNVSSSIAVLLFVTVAGDVVEDGRIREFSTEKLFYEDANARFSLRFENRGNVHLLPRGSIMIYNMFGKERGNIPVNYSRDYGNVLPGSIRKFDFSWKSDSGLWDIGRYKAEATVSYGKDKKQTALATTYFYILPIIPLLQIFVGVLFLILFGMWSIKSYIKKALAIEALKNEINKIKEQKTGNSTENVKLKLKTLAKPIQNGIIDLGHIRAKTHHDKQLRGVNNINGPRSFLYKYRFFFLFIALLLSSVFVLSLFFEDVMRSSRDYDVSELRSDGSVLPLPVNN